MSSGTKPCGSQRCNCGICSWNRLAGACHSAGDPLLQGASFLPLLLLSRRPLLLLLTYCNLLVQHLLQACLGLGLCLPHFALGHVVQLCHLTQHQKSVSGRTRMTLPSRRWLQTADGMSHTAPASIGPYLLDGQALADRVFVCAVAAADDLVLAELQLTNRQLHQSPKSPAVQRDSPPGHQRCCQ